MTDNMRKVSFASARLEATCPVCKRKFTSPELDFGKVADWLAGRGPHHVQDAFPELPPAERELYFLSHVCGECWDRVMREPEEEDEDVQA